MSDEKPGVVEPFATDGAGEVGNGPFTSTQPHGTTISESPGSATPEALPTAAQQVCGLCGRHHPAGRFLLGCPGPRLASGASSDLVWSRAAAERATRERELLRDIGFDDDDPPPAYLTSAVSTFVASEVLADRCFAAAVAVDVDPRQRRRALGAWTELAERLVRGAERVDAAVERLRRSEAEARRVDAEREKGLKATVDALFACYSKHVPLDLDTRKAVVASLRAWHTAYQAGDLTAAAIELRQPPSDAPEAAVTDPPIGDGLPRAVAAEDDPDEILI